MLEKVIYVGQSEQRVWYYGREICDAHCNVNVMVLWCVCVFRSTNTRFAAKIRFLGHAYCDKNNPRRETTRFGVRCLLLASLVGRCILFLQNEILDSRGVCDTHTHTHAVDGRQQVEDPWDRNEKAAAVMSFYNVF